MTRLGIAANELPAGWTLAQLGSLVPHNGVFSDGDWVETKDQDPDGDVRLIQLADVGDGTFTNKSSRFLTSRKAEELRCTYLKKGDILVARMPAPLGRACIFPLDGNEQHVTVVDVCIIRTDPDQVDRTYLCHAINYIRVRQQIEDLQTGTTRKRISRRNLSTVQIPLAPVIEQRRIAARINDLFSQLDSGVQSLATARSALDTYQHAVRRNAFQGALTAQWRATGGDHVESTEALLARMCKEREDRHQDRLADWRTSIGKWNIERRTRKKPSKPRNTVHVVPLDPEQIASLPELPDGWIWCRVEETGDVQLGRQRSPKHASGANMRPYLRVANVFESRIDTSNILRMNYTPSEFRTYELRRGDILLNEGQSLELVGRPAMFNGEVAGCCFQNTLVRFRPASGLDAGYALQVFIHYLKTGRFRQIAKWTNNIAHLGARRFAALEFPLCPILEQQEIVRVLEDQLTAIQRVEREIDAALSSLDTLRQAVLKRAFCGQLARQDPDDERASVLLERISARTEADHESRDTG